MHRSAFVFRAWSGRPAPRIVLAMAVSGLLLAACQPEPASDTDGAPPPTVWVEPVAAAKSAGLSYSGTIRARSDAPVAFRVGGKLSVREVDIGDRVEAGDVIARLDATDFKAALSAEQVACNCTARVSTEMLEPVGRKFD